MKINMDDRYQVMAVNLHGDGKIVMAVAPDENRAYSGDLVELETGKIGTVIISDDYTKGSELQGIETLTDDGLVMVTGIFRKMKCEWEG